MSHPKGPIQPHEFHAQSVQECWQIARDVAMHYQRLANFINIRDERMAHAEHVMCVALRDVADNIAQCILRGRSVQSVCHPHTALMEHEDHERNLTSHLPKAKRKG